MPLFSKNLRGGKSRQVNNLRAPRVLSLNNPLKLWKKNINAIPAGHRAGFVNIVGNPNVGKSTPDE